MPVKVCLNLTPGDLNPRIVRCNSSCEQSACVYGFFVKILLFDVYNPLIYPTANRNPPEQDQHLKISLLNVHPLYLTNGKILTTAVNVILSGHAS